MTAKPIVVGTDGSDQSLRAVDWAAREAALRDVPLRIVSVIPETRHVRWLTPPDSRLATRRAAAEKALADAASCAGMIDHWLTVDTSLLTGEPAPALACVASHASMLVVGGAGEGDRGALSLGPVARYLAAHARCPVAITREQAAAAYGQVVVGIREPGDCEAPLAFAFEEAAHRGAHLLAVQAWHWRRPAGAGDAAIGPARISAEALVRLSRLLEPWREKYPNVEAGEEIVHAHPVQALAELTASADLLVLGRHPGRRGVTDAPLGSVTRAVLHHAHGPVAIVPPDAPDARARG